VNHLEQEEGMTKAKIPASSWSKPGGRSVGENSLARLVQNREAGQGQSIYHQGTSPVTFLKNNASI
jgi:hypothetical protein